MFSAKRVFAVCGVVGLLSCGIDVANADPVDDDFYRVVNGMVDQGERIFVEHGDGVNSMCTVGYVDHEFSRIYTSAHCGVNGETIVAPDEDWLVIGKFQRHNEFDEVTLANDIGWISVDPQYLGGNHFSGDDVTVVDEYDEVCQFGSTSKEVVCGKATFSDGTILVDTVLQGGDSGGPAWSKNGLVGINSFSYMISVNDPNEGSGVSPFTMNPEVQRSHYQHSPLHEFYLDNIRPIITAVENTIVKNLITISLSIMK